ncbi:MAG: phosphatidate cytidylyltransferase [Saprospiraceae bacterium]|nr:phosphatidate cytidylyltransferase [Saprospiraceae bacterium]MCB9343114.1 phosphatidate cytidylyltransferase [Lewinellaceae bacterium]
MRERFITSILFVIVMLGGIFGCKHSFYGLFALLTWACLWELYGLLFAEEPKKRMRQLVGSTWGSLPFILLGGSSFGFWGGGPAFMAMIIIVITAAMFFILELFMEHDRPFDYVGRYLVGLFYIGIPFCLLAYLSMPGGEFFGSGEYSSWRVLSFLGLIWINDTMAYLFGSWFGKRKLFERISPKKTWEGFIAGGLSSMLVAWFIGSLIPEFTHFQWIGLAFVAAVFGTIGDLVESMLKRSLNIKDSGTLLPGHGGLLDRFDAFVFVIPFYWLVLIL